ncbi:hypothetical protein [Streptomyces europaeiscabiei]|uniref:hypothetical protein n=1 Tax=Streptomyces europaeiscabiei TaxID=146819 RepID=UPI0038F7A7FF
MTTTGHPRATGERTPETPDPTSPVLQRARRGDVAVLERRRKVASIKVSDQPQREDAEYTVTVVASVTRAGAVKAIRDLRWSDEAEPKPLERIVGLEKVYVIPQTQVDVAAALAAARAHTYPASDNPRPFSSMDDVRAALNPLRTSARKKDPSR